MGEFGCNWLKILSVYSNVLHKRNAVNLKDRARNVRKAREREGKALGAFSMASN